MAKIKKVWLWWSSGKDSAWALYKLRHDSGRRVTQLVTTVAENLDRVSVHGVRREVARRQAELAGLPLREMILSWPSSNERYEAAVQKVLVAAEAAGVDEMAFGDLFLLDVREYRERLFDHTSISPIFPLWGSDTGALSREMVDGGLEARIVCLDPARVPAELAGQPYSEVLRNLPPEVDPCGENGEMHTCVTAGPFFDGRLDVEVGETVERDGQVVTDLLLSG